jgi:hypothetical protein
MLHLFISFILFHMRLQNFQRPEVWIELKAMCHYIRLKGPGVGARKPIRQVNFIVHPLNTKFCYSALRRLGEEIFGRADKTSAACFHSFRSRLSVSNYILIDARRNNSQKMSLIKKRLLFLWSSFSLVQAYITFLRTAQLNTAQCHIYVLSRVRMTSDFHIVMSWCTFIK